MISNPFRYEICSVPEHHRLNKIFLQNTSTAPGTRDSSTCWKGQGFGECRACNFGNTWYDTIGGCYWWHHWYPITLLPALWRGIMTMFFNPDRPYLPGPGYKG